MNAFNMYALIPLLLAINAVVGQEAEPVDESSLVAYVQHTFDVEINLYTYAESSNIPNVTSLSKYELKCQRLQPAKFLCNTKLVYRVIGGHEPSIPNINGSNVIIPFELNYENGVPDIKVERSVTCKQLALIRKITALVNPGINKPDKKPPFTITAKEQSVMGTCYSNYKVSAGHRPDWQIDSTPGSGLGANEHITLVELNRDVSSCSHTNQYFSSIRHLYAGATIKSATASYLFGEDKPLKTSTSTTGKVLLFGGLVPVTAVEENELVMKSIFQVTSRLLPVSNPKSVDRYFDGKLFECRP